MSFQSPMFQDITEEEGLDKLLNLIGYIDNNKKI